MRPLSTVLTAGMSILSIAAAVPAAAQAVRPIGYAPFDSALFAWEGGRYIDALQRLDNLLGGGNNAGYRVPIALLTGELYQTTTLTTDGRAVRWSPDGSHAVYMTGTGASAVTHVVTLSGTSVREAGVVPAAPVSFGSDGTLAYIDARSGDGVIVIRRLADNTERRISGLKATAVLHSPDGALHYFASDAEGPQLYRLDNERGVAVTSGAGQKTDPQWLSDGSVLYTLDRQRIARTGGTQPVTGTSLTLSADRSRYAYIVRDGASSSLHVVSATGGEAVLTLPYQTAAPRLSPSGSSVAFQGMPREDWELYVIDVAAMGPNGRPRQLTHEIQHDLMPQYLNDSTILAVMGEARHRRSYLYDARTGERTRLFHNNTVRAVAPEYDWVPSPDGRRILIVAERDGDTVSPERGVYLVDLTRQVQTADLRARVRDMLAAETALTKFAREVYAPIAPAVTAAVADISKDRIYAYANELFGYGSKYITQPGNARAIDYIISQLRSWGYEPEVQYFEPTPRGGNGPVRTANIIARLPGTMDPDAVYVVSSHFDSVVSGPGADDDSSGSTALLESARVMAGRPQKRTLEFAFFTGEEAGLLGSREYVRRAVASGKKIVGALNNDMIGFANDQRLDNTIRYSNDGIRDIQHAAAMGFTKLITYDAKYYKSTDAQAYYDAYGDIVGGIGSYPILGNPHYHQSHDVLETINQQLVAEVARTNVATLMLLASSPSRLAGVRATRSGSDVRVEWTKVPESDVRSFVIEWGDGRGSRQVQGRDATSVTLSGVRSGEEVRIKAVDDAGMKSWDWARVVAP
ncbi:MAG TPA: M28 family peptidase [Longimicrobiales bacterium]